MNSSVSNSIFWQYHFKWSRGSSEVSNTTSLIGRNESQSGGGIMEEIFQKPLVAQEFWLFIASSLSLLFFLIIWAFVLVACKLIIRMIQDQNTYEDPELAAFSAPLERNSAMMIQCTILPRYRNASLFYNKYRKTSNNVRPLIMSAP